MSHTSRDKQKLLNRVRRLRGQMKAVEQALESERDCRFVLQTVAACNGAIHSLMVEILEGHLRFVLTTRGVPANDGAERTEELIEIVRAYMK